MYLLKIVVVSGSVPQNQFREIKPTIRKTTLKILLKHPVWKLFYKDFSCSVTFLAQRRVLKSSSYPIN